MEKNIVKNSPVRRPAKKQSGHGRRAKKKHAAAGSTHADRRSADMSFSKFFIDSCTLQIGL